MPDLAPAPDPRVTHFARWLDALIAVHVGPVLAPLDPGAAPPPAAATALPPAVVLGIPMHEVLALMQHAARELEAVGLRLQHQVNASVAFLSDDDADIRATAARTVHEVRASCAGVAAEIVCRFALVRRRYP